MGQKTGLEIVFTKEDLIKYSITFIEDYSPNDSNFHLETNFKHIFKESPSLFFGKSNMHSVANYLMESYYHNEAFIKASFVRKKLMTNDHTVVYELPVNGSRIDLCSFGRSSIGYEIKTDFDNLKRLPQQVKDYSSIFEYLYVICSKKKLSNVLAIVPKWVGVLVFNDVGSTVSYSSFRKAKKSPIISPNAQLCLINNADISSLRKKKKLCVKQKTDLLTLDVNCCFKQAIKNRYSKNWVYLKTNIDGIEPIDYQWYFKNMPANYLSYKASSEDNKCSESLSRHSIAPNYHCQ